MKNNNQTTVLWCPNAERARQQSLENLVESISQTIIESINIGDTSVEFDSDGIMLNDLNKIFSEYGYNVSRVDNSSGRYTSEHVFNSKISW